MHPPKLVFYRSFMTPTLLNLIGIFSVLMVSANSAAFSKISDPFLDPFLLPRLLGYHVLLVYFSSLQIPSSFLLGSSSKLTSEVGIFRASVLSTLFLLVYSSPQNDSFHRLVLNSISMIRMQN